MNVLQRHRSVRQFVKAAVWQLNDKPIPFGHIMLRACMCQFALAVLLLLLRTRVTYGLLSASLCESVHLQV